MNAFKYKVYMMYIDLSELDLVLAQSRLWSTKRFSPARFKRSDYFTPHNKSVDENSGNDESASLDACVRQAVQQELDFYPDGPIRLLTNFRYFGYIINPISCYYCFSKSGSDKLLAMLIEVTNTPWSEKTHYVLDLRQSTAVSKIDFQKTMHVSPFMPMQMTYQWRGAPPGERLKYSLTNLPGNVSDEVPADDITKAVFMAGVNFTRLEINAKNLNAVILKYPFMTLKVAAAIYWQALRLALRKVPFVPHPDRRGS